MVQHAPRRRRTSKAPAKVAPKVAPATNPASLYALPTFPEVGQELTLFAVSARVDIVLTPTRVEETRRRTDDDSRYSEFLVEGLTDRSDLVSFTARTVVGMPDEIRLDSKPVFG